MISRALQREIATTLQCVNPRPQERAFHNLSRIASASRAHKTARSCREIYKHGLPCRLLEVNLPNPRQRSLPFRSFTTASKRPGRLRAAIDRETKAHPILLPFLLASTLGVLGFLGLLIYDQNKKEVSDYDMSSLSPAVKDHLRKAIWYSEIRPNVKIMADSFTKALAQLEVEGADFLSPISLGIYIRFTQSLEKFGQAKGAIAVLEKVSEDLLERIGDVDKGLVTILGSEDAVLNAGGEQPTELPLTTKRIWSKSPELEKVRLRKKVIEIKSKISAIYAGDYIQNWKAARLAIDAAMHQLIQSMSEPRSLRFDENNSDVSAIEASTLLAWAAQVSLGCGHYANALETFKLALIPLRKAKQGNPSCEEVQIYHGMQETVQSMLSMPEPVIDGKALTSKKKTETQQILAGWAVDALRCCEGVKESERDELCVVGALYSLNVLGTTSAEAGDIEGARKYWTRLLQVAETTPVATEPDTPLVDSSREATLQLSRKSRTDAASVAKRRLRELDQKERKLP